MAQVIDGHTMSVGEMLGGASARLEWCTIEIQTDK